VNNRNIISNIMKSISGFFDRHRNRAIAEIQNRILIAEIIKKHIGVDLKIEEIVISSGILRIKSSLIIKNEIFIKKTQILKEINQKINNLKIIDIA